jgi:nitrite reductase/ring-hydroxylating ferredoxin subunit
MRALSLGIMAGLSTFIRSGASAPVAIWDTPFRPQEARGACEESMPRRIDLCAADDIAPGTALKLEHDDLVLAVFNIGGTYYVTDDNCTHGPGSLSEGELYDDVIECNFHGGQFNVRTGEVVAPPCMVPIRTYPTVVENGRVVIEAED